MENKFIEVLDFIKYLLKFEFLGYACISLVLSTILIFILECILIVFKSDKSDTKWFSNFSFLVFTLSLVLCFYENLNTAKFFKSYEDIFIFSFITITTLLLENSILNLLNSTRKKEERFLGVNASLFPYNINEDFSSNYGSQIKNATQLLNSANFLESLDSEYINIYHIKSLINTLKTYPLDEKQYKETEDLEVYLLNFATRQPKKEERIILSNHITRLIKNLSYYENKGA